MRYFVRYFMLLIITVLFSCEKGPLFVNCSDCTKEDPTTVELEMLFDKSALDPLSTTVINVYSGDLEDNVMLYTFIAFSEKFTATLNKKYTVTATYIFNNEKYIAVDSATPRVKYEPDQCTDPCYLVYDKRVNLKLKYSDLHQVEGRSLPGKNYFACN